jgi:hypothetical protein
VNRTADVADDDNSPTRRPFSQTGLLRLRAISPHRNRDNNLGTQKAQRSHNSIQENNRKTRFHLCEVGSIQSGL